MTVFSPVETDSIVFLESKTGSNSTALFEDSTADAVTETNADLGDVADDPLKLKLVPNPVPKIEALVGAGVLVVNEPILGNDNWLIEPVSLGSKLPLFLSVLEDAGEPEEEDDPKSKAAPSPEIVAVLALGLGETNIGSLTGALTGLEAGLADTSTEIGSSLGMEDCLCKDTDWKVLCLELFDEVTDSKGGAPCLT